MNDITRGDDHSQLSRRSKPHDETHFQQLQSAQQLVQAHRAFLRRQEEKVRAAEQLDALEARVLPLGAAARPIF